MNLIKPIEEAIELLLKQGVKYIGRSFSKACLSPTRIIKAHYKELRSTPKLEDKPKIWENEHVELLKKESIEKITEVSKGKSNGIELAEDLNQDKELSTQTLAYLKTQLAPILKLPLEHLNEDTLFQIDSIMVINLIQALETEFGSLPKTLFFEYHTLRELTGYFVGQYTALLQEKFKDELSPVQAKPIAPITINDIQKVGLNDRSHIAQKVEESLVAIIGLSGRYPLANSLEELWENLKTGKDCVTEIPKERWDDALYYDVHQENDKRYGKWGGFISNYDEFDPLFFNISPREAETLDPQERLFLEVAWQTVEDAGYTPQQLPREVGVYVGVMYGPYQLYSRGVALNSSYASIANRVSYCLNLRGPSLAVDTMCSSSLTAIHLACNSLRKGECRLALAGGVNITSHPSKYLLLSQGQFLASEGKCKSFGEGGDGYVPGEGVGAVLLKPLSEAIADGDRIYGIIRGTSINHGGFANGYTVPSPNAQGLLIEEALKDANVEAKTISYLEAHGTGTRLGDPIEIRGLTKAFNNVPPQSCPIGSIKSNIGHLESAAGIVALTKVLLQLKHKQLVPSIHSEVLNSYIEFEKTPFYVQRELTDWQPKMGQVRRAGISSFGAGGSNAHLVVEEGPEYILSTEQHKPYYLVALSAKHSDSLKQRIKDLSAYLEQNPTLPIEAIAYTLNVRRNHFNHRLAMTVGSAKELQEKLEQLEHNQKVQGYFKGQVIQEPEDNVIYKQVLKSSLEKLKNLEAQDTTEYRGLLETLATLYVKGYELDWHLLHQNERQQAIALPTYPFLKERYWLPEADHQNDLPSVDPTKTQKAISQSIPHTSEKTALLKPALLIQEVIFVLKQMVEKVLKIASEKLEERQNLSEYGMDSNHLGTLAVELNGYYQLNLTPAIFYAQPTIRDLSTYLVTEFGEQVSARHSVSAPPPVQSESVQIAKKLSRKIVRPTVETGNESYFPIAIIGMDGLFPQSDSLESFWQHLSAGEDLITEIPASRWDWREYYDNRQVPGKSNSKWGGFINGIDRFDAAFFNISPREAELMDPQHRLFLETVWKVFEGAGYNPYALPTQAIGVFVGVQFNEYREFLFDHLEAYAVTGNCHAILANRISYLFNLQGPSEAIDTACASSLVAIHRAVSALHNQECDLAIAGGVSLALNPQTYVLTSQMGVLSSDGRCKTFDKSANGYVKGEGVGAILLKPLAQAKLEGDKIHGIIIGSAVNHGGKAQSLTAPNPNAQSELLKAAHRVANVHPSTISYIEAHGTGTVLGDPIEIDGLKKAFSEIASKKTCAIGCVKTNIGHLEPAAGIAGVIKVLLSMQHAKLPGNVNFKELNPYIELNNTPFYILEKMQDWQHLVDEQGDIIPRRAGISSFGFGGVNAHAVIEEGPEYTVLTEQHKPYYLICLSAKHPDSLKQRIEDLSVYLARNSSLPIEAVAYTLNASRNHFNHRLAMVVSSTEDLKQKLGHLQSNQGRQSVFKGEVAGSQNETGLREPVLETLLSELKPSDTARYKDLLETLASQYVMGYNVDWTVLHQGEAQQKISLPTYPFLKTRYWIDNPSRQKAAQSLESSAAVETSSADPSLSLPLDSNNAVALNAFALQYLQQIFSEILKIPAAQLWPDKTYEIFGVDSLSGMALIKRLEADFGSLSQTLLFEKNYLTSLSEYFVQEHPNKLRTLLAKFVHEGSLNLKVAGLEKQLPCPAEKVTTAARSDRAAYHSSDDPIAIIGLHGNYPLSETVPAFWDNLKNARDCITNLPINRWNPKHYPVTTKQGIKYYDQGGFINDVDKFDPLFFNISPFEASLMDPQERLFLQTAWKTIEDAGYTRQRLKERVNNEVGVFVGVTYHFYPLYIAEAWSKGDRLPLDIQFFPIANRVSYFFNFSSPSFPIDTACSSSLAAIHLACESIKQGDCKMALAGGVNLSLHPAKYHGLGAMGMLSENGRCMSFAANGTGYVPAEGVGAVLLKPLKQAIQDRDPIYGIIRSTSMNHGGKTSGFTVPNPTAQSELILNALSKADIDARTVNYVEAHGTGTSLGDPIEMKGLQLAFGKYTQDKQFCAIGSVKSNIGHAESAAGISQLTKVLLQLKHKMLVPSLHTETLNPYINFSETAFYVQRRLEEWQPVNRLPRRAGISSFGAGGTNVHIIVEEYVSSPSAFPTQTNSHIPFVFILSAYDEKALCQYIKTFRAFLASESTALREKLENVCYTLQIGREAMSSRFGIVVKNYQALLEKLDNYLENPEPFLKEGWLSNSVQPKPIKASALTTQATGIDYELLTKQWVSGALVDWDTIYASHLPQILSMLPTYPFMKRRCWIANQTTFLDKQQDDSADLQMLPAAATAKADKQGDLEEKKFWVQPPQAVKEWLYTQTWRPTEVTAANNNILNTQEQGCWLIFGDKILAPLLAIKLSKERCILCLSGETFAQVSSGVFTVNPSEPQDYQKMFSYITGKMNIKITQIVYLWPCDQVYVNEKHELDLVEMSKVEEKSSILLIVLKKLVEQSTLHSSLKFSIVTRSGQAVLDTDQVHLWQHHLWALTGIFTAEYPQYLVKHIDLDAQADLKIQLDWLYSTLCDNSKETYFAHRNGQKYVLRLTHSTEQSDISQEIILKVPRAALITGGLGALGLEVANWLVERGTQRLLLIGNTILPDRSEWENVSKKELKSRINGLIALEAKGAYIHYAAVDVSDQEKMKKLVSTCEAEWQETIESVFHLAGITTDSVTIDRMSNELLKKVLAPKIQGTLILHEIFKLRSLKHFVLFSSVSAIPYFGLNGLTAYATANAFLEGFAYYRRGLKLPALCISWTAWQDKGMSFEYKHTALLDVIGLQALPITQGIQIMEYLLSLNYVNSIVQKVVDWHKFFSVNPNLRQQPYFEDFYQQQDISDRLVLNLSHSAVYDIVTKMFAELMQLLPDEIDHKKLLQDYGLDSILGVNFVIKLGETFPDIVSVMDLYRYNNLEQLINYIAQKQQPSKTSPAVPDRIGKNDHQTLLDEIIQLNEEEVYLSLKKEIETTEIDS